MKRQKILRSSYVCDVSWRSLLKGNIVGLYAYGLASLGFVGIYKDIGDDGSTENIWPDI